MNGTISEKLGVVMSFSKLHEEYEYLIGKKYQFERSVYMSYIGRDGQKYETLEQVVLADKKYKMIEEQN